MQKGTGLLLEYLISMIESRDFFAEHHCEKVRKFTEIMLVKIRQFCPEYKLSVKECENIAFAAMMHDLGKMTIPDHILHKPGKLTFEEKQMLTELVQDTLADENSTGIQVYIGNETPIRGMRDCSVVTATYELDEGMKGTIGIIGPKRMDYEKVVSNLKMLKNQLDDLYKK